MNSLQILQAYARKTSLDVSHVTLCDKEKTLLFLDGTPELPSNTADGTQLYNTSTLTPVDSAESSDGGGAPVYSLASLYLLCLHPHEYMSYRKACGENSVKDPVKIVHRTDLVTMLLGEKGVQKKEDEDDDDDGLQEDEMVGGGERSKKDEERRHSKHDKHHHKHRDHKHKDRHDKHKHDKHKRDHKHKHRDGSSSKHGKDHKDSIVKKEHKPITDDMVMKNLTLVAAKRGDGEGLNKAVTPKEEPATDLPNDVTMDDTTESNDVITTDKSSDNRTKDEHEQTATTSSSPTNVIEIGTTESYRTQIQSALSAFGYIVDDPTILSQDRTKTQKIMSMEIPVGNSHSVLRAQGKNLSRVLDVYNESVERQKKQAALLAKEKSRNKRPGSSSSNHHSSSSSDHKRSRKSDKNPKTGNPIIIVPNAMTSPITMINAKEFLDHGKYVPRDICLKSGKRKAPSFTFTRKISPKHGGREITYEVIDNPSAHCKSSNDWNRIVAVIPQGAAWQFKKWKYENPVDIFTRSFGYYIGMDGAPPPKELMTWNVKRGTLHRDKRGMDSVTYAGFWNSLDEWMAVHKREYFLVKED